MAGSRAQQAAIAISMKKAGKKPKMQNGGGAKLRSIDPGFSNLPKQHGKLVTKNIDPGFSKVDKVALNNAAKRKIKTDPVSGGIQYKKGGTTPAWTRKEGKNPEGGLNAKGVASYRAANPGSKLQTAVTTKPSKLKPGSKDAKRRKSFCSRMSGMPGPMKDEKGRPTRKALSLRKWNC